MTVGGRIRHHRLTGGRTQAAVASLCGISEDYLGKIERGHKNPSQALLHRLAHELGVQVAALLTDEPAAAPQAPVTHEASIAQAMMGCGTSRGTEPATPAALRERVEAAWRIWQTSAARFTDAEAVLPALITDIELAGRARRTGNDAHARRETLRIAADLYGLLHSYCRRTGRLDLALVAADRAIRAAQDADDPLRIAAGQWNLGHVLLSDDRPDAPAEAAEVAALAINQLRHETAHPDIQAAQGALELVCAAAAAAQRNWWEARERLEKRAAPLAEQAGEGNVQWTVFGPTNVELHAVSIEMLAGEASEGLRRADQVDTSQLPSKERQFTFGLQVARCYDLHREDAAVLVHLLHLEELSPQDLQRSPQARDMVTALLHRVRPTYQRQVGKLAERLNIV
ncbi:XRE family transcriptional regulator [Streptomyces inhibens]|uniref:XRE family transcriptional regulator n=1 Tax=Streptomyces inhibens TaxID=2293571 RepID=A0A371Q8U9_STRIH|nr:helix-turn-helix transcriptional regulator [Streptomyces inhibens]REK91094.1 XRE family transcriptional regulator [Streptomyces inhibens]